MENENQNKNENQKRMIVGCVPYRYIQSSTDKKLLELQVLVISQMGANEWSFPLGDWKQDCETEEQGVLREARETAGINVEISHLLQDRLLQINTRDEDVRMHAYRFSSFLGDDVNWTKKDERTREWMSVEEAHQGLCYDNMKKALGALEHRLPTDKINSLPDIHF